MERKMMERLKIAFLAGFMEGFSTEGLKLFKAYQKDLKKMADSYGFDLVCIDSVISDLETAINVRNKLDDEKVDFALLFHPSYIIGDFIYEIMKSRAYFGLWAIKELSDQGPMPLASIVNLEQNAGIANHNFPGNPKKTKWFFGDLEGKYFKPRFDITIKALKALKGLKDARIAQIGKLADGHINHMVNTRAIYSSLKVDVLRDYEVEDIIKLSKEVKSDKVDEVLERLGSSCKVRKVSNDRIVESVKMYLAIKDLCEKERYQGVALSCWPKLMPEKEMVGCLINSLLNSDKIVAGCEADVLGTVSMLVLSKMTSEPVAIMDLPVFDDDDNSLLLWHCGSAPFEMAGSKQIYCQKHYFADYTESAKDVGPIIDIIFREGDVTIFRIAGEGDKFYYVTGKFFDEDKKSFDGSRGWVNDLRLYDKSINTMDLANTIFINGLPHHFPIVLENIGRYLEEFAYWSGLKKVQRYDYKDYLEVK